MDSRVSDEGRLYLFGPFRLDADRRVLTRDGEQVVLPHRAFELLLTLVRNAGQVLSKDELLEIGWPGRIVEEGNLTQAISTLRKALGVGSDESQYIATASGRGYCFTAVVGHENWSPQPESMAVGDTAPVTGGAADAYPRKWSVQYIVVGAFCALLVVGLAGFLWYRPATSTPAKSNAVVLLNFQNFTNDPVFDRVLGKALEIDLAQSPFMKLLTAQQVQATLALMSRPKDQVLTPQIAQEACARNNGTAVLDGTIGALGSKYLLTLSASDCVSGKTIAEEKEEADGKEAIIPALDRLAGRIRGELGESLDSIEKFDVPLLPEKTASFDALKAYSEGVSLYDHGKRTESIAMFQHAVELDPNFVMAYADLSAVYNSTHDEKLAFANISKAYALRDTLNERQRFFVETMYEESGTKDILASIKTYRLWTETYPEDGSPWSNLANAETWLGQFPPAIEAAKHALALAPTKESTNVILARAYAHNGQFDQARTVCLNAVRLGIAGDDTRELLLEIAYAQGDRALVEQQLQWAKGTPGERTLLLRTALIALSQGKAREASRIFDEGAESSKLQGLKDYTAPPRARLLADIGFKDEAQKLLVPLDGDTSPRDYLFTLAEVGDETKVNAILKQDLADGPDDTLLNNFFAPEVRAALALRHGRGAEAVADLKPTMPYELRVLDVLYLRGTAYLAASDGAGAAHEFQKLLDNRGVDSTTPLIPLSKLGLARAYKLENNIPASKRAYEMFFEDWKDADSDIPILQAAKAEYAGLNAASRLSDTKPQ